MSIVLCFLLAFLATPIICSSNIASVDHADEISNRATDTFQILALEEHNRFRALHGCPPLLLDTSLSDYAQEWADNLALKNKLEHRPGSPYGENLYMVATGPVYGVTVVRSWYSQITFYNFDMPGYTPRAAGFTQLIWKNSKKMGIGRKINRYGAVFVVAYYSPSGNIDGQYSGNVPRKLY